MKHLVFIAFLLVSVTSAGSAERSTASPCERCHFVEGWQQAAFNHSKTDFELKGSHQTVPCKRCHPGGSFGKMTDKSCSACHKDVHAGALGKACEKCHDETGWRGRFAADDHRKTNFPLIGRHALIPCEECHGDMRERSFSRTPLTCVNCHQSDYDATAAKGISHTAFGFDTNCQRCHNPLKWKPAFFAAHEACFPIVSGAHSRFACTDCHTRTAGLTATPGTCSTGTTTCTGCHTGAHSQSRTNPEHADVPGYQYKDPKCYECHHAN